MVTNYTGAVIFTKFTNMSPWFETKYGREYGEAGSTSLGFNQLKHHYSKDRDVQLILLYRHERGTDNASHIMCKIKCPINPLPIKGEFEVVSIAQIAQFLEREGWSVKQKLPTSLLK